MKALLVLYLIAGAMWLVSIYMIQAIGELCLSPVGLSVTTKVAPRKYAGQMMGVWFLAVTAGNCITSLLALVGVEPSGAGAIGAGAVLASVAGFAIFMYRKRVAALMGDVR